MEALTFLVIDNLTLVMLLHLHVIDSCVTNITADRGVRGTVIGNCLEETGAARSGTSEDQTHFTGFQKSRVSEKSTGSVKPDQG